MKKHLKITREFENPLRDGRKREIFHAATIPVGTFLDLEEKESVLRYGTDLDVVVVRKIITVNPKSMGENDKYSRVEFDIHKLADTESKKIATAPKRELRESEFLRKLLENSEEVAADASDWLRENNIWDEWGLLKRLLEKGKVSREDILEAQKELDKESEA